MKKLILFLCASLTCLSLSNCKSPEGGQFHDIKSISTSPLKPPGQGWIEFRSLFDPPTQGKIGGSFWIRQEGNELQMHLPLLFLGENKFTADYFDKVVSPVLTHLKLLHPDDLFLNIFPPKKSLFTQAQFAAKLRLYIDELVRVYAEIGIDLSIDCEYLPFSSMGKAEEQALRSRGQLQISDTLMKEVWSKDQDFRETDRLTFALLPVPLVSDTGYLLTADYNPSAPEFHEVFLHEVTHMLFLGKSYDYEGYDDPYNPLFGVMNDIQSQALMRKRNQRTRFSSAEAERIYESILGRLHRAGVKSDIAEASLKKYTQEKERRMQFYKLGLLNLTTGDIRDRHKNVANLNRQDWSGVWHHIDASETALIEFDERGRVISVQGSWKDSFDKSVVRIYQGESQPVLGSKRGSWEAHNYGVL